MKQTKEQLIAEVSKLRQSHEGWVAGDERKRKEFAKAFNWYKIKRNFGFDEREIKTPSWAEIFVELGKVLAARNFMDCTGDIESIRNGLKDLENKIEEIK